MDSPVPLMHHDPGRSCITDPDPDHPKGTQPVIQLSRQAIPCWRELARFLSFLMSVLVPSTYFKSFRALSKDDVEK